MFSTDEPIIFRLVLALGSKMVLLSSFFIFLCSIYFALRTLWMGTLVTFFLGLLCSIISSVILLIFI